MTEIVYISKEGLEALKAEFETLKMKTIPAIAGRIDDAKQNGDLSENAEYQDAKEQMAFAQGRLLELEDMINRSMLIEEKRAAQKIATVQIGSRIVVSTEDKTKKEFQIVGSAEAQPLAGKISNESPLGAAFLGCEVGEVVEVQKPSGVAKYTILSIS